MVRNDDDDDDEDGKNWLLRCFDNDEEVEWINPETTADDKGRDGEVGLQAKRAIVDQ